VKPQFSDLIDNLVVTTKLRIAPVPLLWSAALRVDQAIFIQAYIEYVDFPAKHRNHSYICFTDSGEAASITTSLIHANFDTYFVRMLAWPVA